MLEVLKDENKKQYIVKIMTKRSFTKGRFDGYFGFFITVKNWMIGIFDSYCHTELNFLDGWSWSASEAKDRLTLEGKKAGTGFKNIEYSHSERWVELKIDVRDKRLPKSYKNVYELKEACIKLTGKDYDVLGCVGQAISIDNVEDSGKFFCSEAVGHVLGYGPLSPARLYNKIKANLKGEVV